MRKIFAAWVEILIGAFLLYQGAYTLLALFVYLVLANIRLHQTIDRLRAILRTFQVANEAKLMAIAGKLGVLPEDAVRQLEDLTAEQRESLEKDFRKATGEE